MEPHTRQSLETVHHLPAGSAAVGCSPLQDTTNTRRRLAAFAKAIMAGVRHRYASQRDYEQLLEQPDYLLFDVGLTREAVQAARHGRSAWRGQAEANSGTASAPLKLSPESFW